MLYVTDRAPAVEGEKDLYYRDERGEVARAGIADIGFGGEEGITWEEARKISLAKTRSDKYPLYIEGVEELGVLHEALPYGFLTDEEILKGEPAADAAFAELVNKKLAMSKRKDIYIYVPGYKVIFENPCLVATELWHFLGYDGVAVAYSWPASPKVTAYMKDSETAELSGTTLRLLIEYLARNTQVERIHVLGFSQGTRVVLTAFHQLALLRPDKTKEEIRAELRMGTLTVVGSDFDRGKFASAVGDGMLKIADTTTVYGSEHDTALAASRFLLARDRLGHIVDTENASDTVRSFMASTQELFFIDVTEAEGSDLDNGHGYFRNSPWASSDVLMNMMYGLKPAERGLVRGEDGMFWVFPEDYVERLRTAIIYANPEMEAAFEAQEARSAQGQVPE